MSSNHIVTRRFGAALVAALMVSVLALGCASDDEGDATTEAATGATGSTDTGTRTLGEGIENLQEAQAQLCPAMESLSADLDGALHRRGRGQRGRPCRRRIHCSSSRSQRPRVD